ncbi:unnamed protein product [Moneuplotes crassus]|uniref:Uncharacterized protein n=1 Tax=Euplotes crassus TaxID=5936 RepID=A0AAD1U6T1_EUPCR|nr:unnamed protein product [Moneuplotes crassus]
MKNGRTTRGEIHLSSQNRNKPYNTTTTQADIHEFNRNHNCNSTEIIPHKGEIETIEVIDEWALIYCEDDIPITRNTVNGYNTYFQPPRPALQEERKVQEISDSKLTELGNTSIPTTKSSLASTYPGKHIRFTFKENIEAERKNSGLKLHKKCQSNLKTSVGTNDIGNTRLNFTRKFNPKKTKGSRSKNQKLRRDLNKTSIKSLITQKLAPCKKKMKDLNSKSFYSKPKKRLKVLSFRKDPNSSKLYHSLKQNMKKTKNLEILKEKSNKDLYVVPVSKADCIVGSSKQTSESSEEDYKDMSCSEGSRPGFPKKFSKHSLIKSHIMETYVNSVEKNNSYRNRNSLSIGEAIRHSSIANTATKEDIKLEPVSKDNIKKLNLRNSRAKFHETLVGGMIDGHHPISRVRSDYQVTNGVKLWRPFTTIAKLNYVSPTLSLYKSDVGNVFLRESLSGNDSDLGCLKPVRLASRIEAALLKPEISTGEEDCNLSDQLQRNNTSNDLDFDDLSNLIPFDDQLKA